MPVWREKLTEYQKKPGLLSQLSKLAEAMCAPFWWSLQEDPKQPAQILNNGSLCYLNTGAVEIAVSADHVVDAYLLHLAEYGDAAVECQFGGSTISPEKRLIAWHDSLDLATLSVPEIFVNASAQAPRTQHKPLTWPPTRAQKDEFVVYGGYPGILRENKIRTADFHLPVDCWRRL